MPDSSLFVVYGHAGPGQGSCWACGQPRGLARHGMGGPECWAMRAVRQGHIPYPGTEDGRVVQRAVFTCYGNEGLVLLGAALTDAATYRLEQGTCTDCEAGGHADGKCPDHRADGVRAAAYDGIGAALALPRY